jgi:hypothetical protein
VLAHLPGFLEHVRSRVYRQGGELGIVPPARPNALKRAYAMGYGLALFARSQFARSKSTLTETYIAELGLDGSGSGSSGSGNDDSHDDDDSHAVNGNGAPARRASA